MADFSEITRITLLAVADSINPCAFAVLAMILMTIIMQEPGNRKKVLYAGLAFISSIYLGYLFYGIVIVQFFNSFAELLKGTSSYIYDGLAVLAMILGALNIKDFLFYRQGSFGTEMPIFLRPKVKRIISKVTSVRGAFFTGLLVTLFLLPCTIGPYIVASGLLAKLGIFAALPWLLYYNLVFVIPMLFIVGIVYYGFKEVDEISGWRLRNIRILHLAAGILMFLVGIGMIAR